MDETGRVAGRGAYLCRDGGCWQLALGKGALTRALGTPLPADLRAALTTNETTTMMTMTTGGDERGEE